MSKANFMAGMQNFALYRSHLKSQVENSKKQREDNVHKRNTQNGNNDFSRKNHCPHKFDEKNVDYLRTFLGKGPVLLFEHYMRTGEYASVRKSSESSIQCTSTAPFHAELR